MKLGMLQALLPEPRDENGDRVFVVQSGSPDLATRLVDSLRARFPRSALSVLLRRDAVAVVPVRPGVEYIVNEGPKPAFVRKLQARRFDRVFVLVSGEAGYWKLQLLPFLLGANAVLAVDENLGWFPADLRHTDQIARHLRYRLETSLGDRTEGAARNAARAVARAITYPGVLGYLITYERARNAAARLRGAAPWKRENRPETASGEDRS